MRLGLGLGLERGGPLQVRHGVRHGVELGLGLAHRT